MTRSMIICPVTSSRAASALAVISPKPTVAKTATVKYSALVRVMGWLKLLAGRTSVGTPRSGIPRNTVSTKPRLAGVANFML